MRRLLLLAAVLALTVPSTADAGGLRWVHKAVCKVGVGCRDVAPPGPNVACTADQQGDIITVYDPRLGAYVEWQCRDGKWFRLRIVPDTFYPTWSERPKRAVYDWHRRCKSIVCKARIVRHFYPRLWITAPA